MSKTNKTLIRLAKVCDGDHRLDSAAFTEAAIEAGFIAASGRVAMTRLAKGVGVHRTLIHRHVKGELAPSVHTLAAYGKALDVDPVSLVKLSRARAEVERLKKQVRELGGRA